MSNCDLCGREKADIDAIVEGTMLTVCNACADYGKVVAIKQPEIKKETQPREIRQLEEEPIVSIDYSEKIKQARERLNLRQEELADRLGEKESVIQKLETKRLEPSINLIKKLEQFLKISLLEKEQKTKSVSLNLKDNKLTIGDLLKIKDDKKTTSD